MRDALTLGAKRLVMFYSHGGGFVVSAAGPGLGGLLIFAAHRIETLSR